MDISQAVSEREGFHVFLREVLTAKKRVLILSTGGGNDYIGAYAIAKLISKYHPEVNVFFASSIYISGDYKPLIRVKNNLFTINDFSPNFDFETKNHSLRLIALGIKNEKMNLPYFVSINNNDPEKIRYSYQELFDEIMPDCIFTVDNGGDSITGGLDGANGFDQANLNTLLGMKRKTYHLVIGPGSDGESSIEDFNQCILMQFENFRGIFDIGEAVDLVYDNVMHNSEVMLEMDHRWSTMRIIFEANTKVKQGFGEDLFTIPRHNQNQIFPFNILQSVLAFGYN